jgi:hypothetical protein
MSALRPLPRWAEIVLLPLINLSLAFIVSGIVVLAIGQDPLAALNAIVGGAFGNGYNRSTTRPISSSPALLSPSRRTPASSTSAPTAKLILPVSA